MAPKKATTKNAVRQAISTPDDATSLPNATSCTEPCQDPCDNPMHFAPGSTNATSRAVSRQNKGDINEYTCDHKQRAAYV